MRKESPGVVTDIGRRRYVLISACRNEGGYVAELVDSIKAQTIAPLKWIVVDDGSTDDTFSRAEAGANGTPFIQVVRMPGGRPRSFTSQVFAALHGCELARELDYDYIGFLDADIRVDADYYERIVTAFENDARLGLCGGAVVDKYEDRVEYLRRGSEEYHVPGGVQFFRRECFEDIGGFVPIEGGGQDSIADIMTMMHGWKVRVLPQLLALHLRPDGFARDHVLERGMKWGRKFYLLGYHPFFFFMQCVRRVGYRPYVLGSLCGLRGFALATWRGEPRPVSEEFVRFLRRIQMRRLWDTLRRYAHIFGQSSDRSIDEEIDLVPRG